MPMLGTILELLDVKGCPKVTLDLPGPLRIGDRVAVSFRLQRRNAGRTEVLDVRGEVRVTSASLDATGPTVRQLIGVETTSPTPLTWKAVKNRPEWKRQLPPARFPKTSVR
jgi:hypothetical protein